jgi:hypothetical protein
MCGRSEAYPTCDPWNFFLVANAIGRNASDLDLEAMSAVVVAPFER